MNLIRTPQRPVMQAIDIFLTLMAWAGLVLLLVRGLVPMLDSNGGPRPNPARQRGQLHRERFGAV